ncbi:polymeric immunoglobulin receptor-like, partial [Astyanax mexicanus]
LAGLVVCFDVIGYSRGSVIIYCIYQQDKGNDKYFCKESTNQCVNQKSDQRQNSWDHKGRVSLNNFHGGLMVIYRDLSVEDAGLYQCGETGVWSHTVNLKVKKDPCCLGPKTVSGYAGETTTISFSYPEEFQTENKLPYKLDGQILSSLIKTNLSQKGRFSISDNRRSRVISVRISGMREEDGGVYYCAVGDGGNELGYYSLFSEIHLQVSGSSIIFIIIISVSICVVLLLIGGLTLIFYKLRCSRTPGTTDADYENDPPGSQNIRMGPVYQRLNPNTNQSDSVYQSLNPNTNQSDSVYQSLNPNTNQSDSVYQSLNPKTNQSDSVYQRLNRNTNQSDSVYQSLNPNTNQSDSVYQSLNPNTNQSDSVYQRLNRNTNQSDSVYQSLNPNTNQSDSVYQSLNPKTNQSDSVYQSLNPKTNQSDSVYQSLNPTPTNQIQSTRV